MQIDDLLKLAIESSTEADKRFMDFSAKVDPLVPDKFNMKDAVVMVAVFSKQIAQIMASCYTKETEDFFLRMIDDFARVHREAATGKLKGDFKNNMETAGNA